MRVICPVCYASEGDGEPDAVAELSISREEWGQVVDLDDFRCPRGHGLNDLDRSQEYDVILEAWDRMAEGAEAAADRATERAIDLRLSGDA